MTYRNTNVRGSSVGPAQEAKLFAQMRQHGEAERAAYQSMSGADVAGAPLDGICRRFYVMLWEGVAVEEALADCDRQWRAYALENNAKVQSAGKTKRGPMEGHSVIAYRWTDLERFESKKTHLRQMAKLLAGEAP